MGSKRLTLLTYHSRLKFFCSCNADVSRRTAHSSTLDRELACSGPEGGGRGRRQGGIVSSYWQTPYLLLCTTTSGLSGLQLTEGGVSQMHFSVTYDRGFKLLKTSLLPRCRACDCIYLSLRSMNLISHCYFRHKNCNWTENPSNTLQTAANANIL